MFTSADGAKSLPTPRGMSSHRRCCEDTLVNIVAHLLEHLFGYRISNAPLICRHRVGRIVDGRVPGVFVDDLKFGGVLQDISVRIEEVGEGVVADPVSTRTSEL